MYHYKIKTSFIFVENWIKYDARHTFPVWLRTGSNPPDINRFRSGTGKKDYLNLRAIFLLYFNVQNVHLLDIVFQTLSCLKLL